jgi:hypothetical protein
VFGRQSAAAFICHVYFPGSGLTSKSSGPEGHLERGSVQYGTSLNAQRLGGEDLPWRYRLLDVPQNGELTDKLKYTETYGFQRTGLK